MMTAASAGSRRVFIVEDSELVRNRLTEQLASVPGIELVGYAESATAAVLLISHLRPDAVVLDLGLPDGNGFRVLEHAKRLDPRPLVVVLTNYPQEEYRRECLALGADAFLDKSREFNKLPVAILGSVPDDLANIP